MKTTRRRIRDVASADGGASGLDQGVEARVGSCPDAAPTAGAECAGPIGCSYGDSSRPDCRATYVCAPDGTGGDRYAWLATRMGCVDPPPNFCPRPAALWDPARPSRCPRRASPAPTPAVVICQCPCGDRLCAEAQTWDCYQPPSDPGCPAAVPNLGTAWHGARGRVQVRRSVPGRRRRVFCRAGLWGAGQRRDASEAPVPAGRGRRPRVWPERPGRSCDLLGAGQPVRRSGGARTGHRLMTSPPPRTQRLLTTPRRPTSRTVATVPPPRDAGAERASDASEAASEETAPLGPACAAFGQVYSSQACESCLMQRTSTARRSGPPSRQSVTPRTSAPSSTASAGGMRPRPLRLPADVLARRGRAAARRCGRTSPPAWRAAAADDAESLPALAMAFACASAGPRSLSNRFHSPRRCIMPQVVDFETVSTVGLESSPVAAALAGLRGHRGPLFQEQVRPRLHRRARDQSEGVCRLGAPHPQEDRDIVIHSRPLEATRFQVENLRIAYVFL